MKKSLLFSMAVLLCCAARPQTADHLYYRSLDNGYDYRANSFVIDYSNVYTNRGVLLWAANTDPYDNGLQSLSLDQLDFLGNTLTEHVNLQSGLRLYDLQPKKIIRSEFTKSYYLLGYVTGSPNGINGVQVYSTPYVLKLDDNLNLIWASKIHFNLVTAGNAGAEIEYNDILETSDRHVVLVGRYRENDASSQALQLAKLDELTGANIWWYWYYMDNYDVNGLSVEECTNKELVVTGYAQTAGVARELLFAKFKSNGGPLLFRRYQYKRIYDISGSQISRMIDQLNRDRFFITGYAEVEQSDGSSAPNRQNLIVDISQDGTLNSAAHYGDAGAEEINSHIFSFYLTPPQIAVINFTGYTTSYGPKRAYYSSLEYNTNTKLFSTRIFEAIRNDYSSLNYDSRAGLEIKYAGNRLFALLLNSTTSNTGSGYTHEVTNVFIRDFNVNPVDSTCLTPKTPKLTQFNPRPFVPVVNVKDPPYAIYDEKWEPRPKIVKKVACGSNWRVYPELAVQGIVRRNRYEGPGDVVPVYHRMITSVKKQAEGSMLFPNPAESEISFMQPATFSSNLPATISLYSSDMRIIRSLRASASPVQKVPVGDLKPGLYVLQLQQGVLQKSYRFVKK